MSTVNPAYGDQPGDDDLDTEALPIRRRPRLSALTAVLALAAVAAGAFMGGVEIQKHSGASSTASAGTGGTGFAAARAARSGRSAQSGGVPAAGAFRGAAGNATVGLVTLIKGTTLYVTDLSGNTVKVTTTRGLQVSKTVTTTVRGIHPGDSVVVRGTKQKNGSYKATSVTIGDLTSAASQTGGAGAFPGGGSNGG
jgi:hypothetical protein